MKKIIFYLLILLASCKNTNKNSISPKFQDITESVYASVKVHPYNSYFVQSLANGIIEEIYIEEGCSVKKGDVLFKIKADLAKNRLDEAQLFYQETKENFLGANNLLKNIEIEIQTAKQRLELDSLQFFKLERLWNQSIGSKNEVDNAKLKYETAQNNLTLLEKKYKQTRNDLELAYEKAINRVDMEQNNLNDFTIQSLLDGVVYEVNKEVGEIVSLQDRIAEIGSADSFKIEMDIDEVDIALVSIGDTAIIALDAYPTKVFKAIITNILPKKDIQNLTYRLHSLFIEKPERLLYGLSGEANIIVDKRNNALTIPTEFLKSTNTVLTKDGEITIETGMKNMQFVEVLSGIDTSTVLIKPE